jgi:hypothetical protein
MEVCKIPFCPKCETEYIEFIKKCKECDVLLVNELQIDKYDYHYDEGEFLTTASDDFEADLLTSLLVSEGIHVIQKHEGVTQYLKVYMGSSNFGVDIRVPKQQLEKAKEILKSCPVEYEYEDEINKEMDAALVENKKSRGRKITALLLFLHVPGIFIWLFNN